MTFLRQEPPYFLQAREIFSGRSPGPILSGDQDKAADFKRAFDEAKTIVRILEASLSSVLFSDRDVAMAARRFLRRHGRIELLVPYNETHSVEKFFQTLQEWPGQVEIRTVPRKLVAEYKCDFFIVDENAYRYLNDRLLSKVSVVAGGYDNKVQMEKLLSIFGELKEQSSPWLPLARGTPLTEPVLEAS